MPQTASGAVPLVGNDGASDRADVTETPMQELPLGQLPVYSLVAIFMSANIRNIIV